MEDNGGKEITSNTAPVNRETLPAVPKNRILIFGSGGTGIFELQKDFKEYLTERGIKDSQVQTVKHVENIEPAIFNTYDIPESEEERGRDLPKGIIVLPTIKQQRDGIDFPVDVYSTTFGNGQVIPDYIKAICDKYQIPVVFLKKNYSREETEKEINKLLKLNKRQKGTEYYNALEIENKERYPQLKILLNKDFDKKICFDFLNTKADGIDFGNGIIQLHPRLSEAREMNEPSAKDMISKYFDQFYLEHQDELEQTRKETDNIWLNKRASFFKACDKYFEHQPWPKGKYEAYLSIINCNPRFLEDKTFQFYWHHPQGFLTVGAHEMLHFLFFDAAKKLIPNMDPEDQKLWEISEVFNGLIMEESEFTQITGIKKPEQYPDLIRAQNELRDVWSKNKQVKSFILSTLSS